MVILLSTNLERSARHLEARSTPIPALSENIFSPLGNNTPTKYTHCLPFKFKQTADMTC